ncbi:hypothetical protein SY83_09390 [Paenibacillus swuensis]|uniref:Uncharacterized protein n=1 Tax=Paenibacillus swuensis TaxID=1178515 RepID=A0A172THL3_9BACL|nr:hypothetical protein [Paenibacillus swuensis]ANE46452.1 hypothetical protein SY83_09390 [Paenibacillus swuensis]
MEAQLNLIHKIGLGISPQQFMDGMQIRTMELSKIPNTKERLLTINENHDWTQEDHKAFLHYYFTKKIINFFPMGFTI